VLCYYLLSYVMFLFLFLFVLSLFSIVVNSAFGIQFLSYFLFLHVFYFICLRHSRFLFFCALFLLYLHFSFKCLFLASLSTNYFAIASVLLCIILVNSLFIVYLVWYCCSIALRVLLFLFICC